MTTEVDGLKFRVTIERDEEQMTAKTFDYNECRIQIEQDEDAEPPEQDEHAFIVTTDNRYFVQSSPLVSVGGKNIDIDAVEETHHTYPLYAYVHSGVALSLGRDGQFSDQWDSGQI